MNGSLTQIKKQKKKYSFCFYQIKKKKQAQNISKEANKICFLSQIVFSLLKLFSS